MTDLLSTTSRVPQLRPVVIERPDLAMWRDVAAADRDALPEQLPEWIGAICSSGRWTDATRGYDFPDGRSFVLPMVRLTRSAGSLSIFASPPHAWGMGGLLGRDQDPGVVAAVIDDLESLRAARVSIRIDPRHDVHWRSAASDRAVTIERRAHVIDLEPGPDRLLESLNKSTRKSIRRAERNGVEVVVEHTGARLHHHYELYLRSVERWASTQHEPLRLALWRARRRDPIEKLHRMAEAMQHRFRHVIAYVDGAPAASAVVLLGGTARDTRGAIDRELAKGTGANDAVQWRAITEAHAHGCRWYNLGESGRSDNLAAYKERFGAIAIDHFEYRFERLPITRVDTAARGLVKRAIGFKDV